MRYWRILIAHVRANLFCLREMWRWPNPNAVLNLMVVCTKYSINEKGSRQTRHIGVGFWQRSLVRGVPDQWIDFVVFFKEEFNLEKQAWTQVAPPILQMKKYTHHPL